MSANSVGTPSATNCDRETEPCILRDPEALSSHLCLFDVRLSGHLPRPPSPFDDEHLDSIWRFPLGLLQGRWSLFPFAADSVPEPTIAQCRETFARAWLSVAV